MSAAGVERRLSLEICESGVVVAVATYRCDPPVSAVAISCCGIDSDGLGVSATGGSVAALAVRSTCARRSNATPEKLDARVDAELVVPVQSERRSSTSTNVTGTSLRLRSEVSKDVAFRRAEASAVVTSPYARDWIAAARADVSCTIGSALSGAVRAPLPTANSAIGEAGLA
ncbi:hypothetical protein [Methylosinus sp. PW1]|uniref:hypothetical protein n=1 Tax=Methylosinus sp. PW1 TaxID=107636 RepID=UPI0018DE3D61|nr:hypothetical protein [Methylosinus sp. PW1]